MCVHLFCRQSYLKRKEDYHRQKKRHCGKPLGMELLDEKAEAYLEIRPVDD
jgi:hypothetical protein